MAAAASSASIACDKFPAMPTARTFCKAYNSGNEVFVVGGSDANGMAMGNFESVDVSKRKLKWNRLAEMPTRRAGASGGFVDNKLVLIGGIDETRRPHEVVDAYDLKTKSWSTMDSLSEPRQGIATFVRDSGLHAIGGMQANGNPSDAYHSLDMERNKWFAQPPLKSSRYATTAFIVNDAVYAMAGRVGKLPSVACEFYDFRQKQWEELPDAPSQRVFRGSASDPKAQRIYFFGGLKQPATEGFCNELQVFDIRANKWDKLVPDSPTPRDLPSLKADLVCEYLNGRLVVAGGMGAESMQVAPQVFTHVHAYDPVKNSWSLAGELHAKRSGMAAAMLPGAATPDDADKKQKLIIIGGIGQNGPTNAADIVTFS